MFKYGIMTEEVVIREIRIYEAAEVISSPTKVFKYGIMTEELVIREIRIDEAAEVISSPTKVFKYGIMTEQLVIREIRIDEATGRDDSDSHMTSFEVIMPLKLQSTMKALFRP